MPYMNTENAKYNITDAEWKIMKVLWSVRPKDAEGRLSLAEILEGLKGESSWNANTVRTLIVRLADKGIVGVDRSGGRYGYYPLADMDECVMQETKSLLSRIFGGSSSQLFSALVKGGGISEKERGEILELIQNMEEK